MQKPKFGAMKDSIMDPTLRQVQRYFAVGMEYFDTAGYFQIQYNLNASYNNTTVVDITQVVAEFPLHYRVIATMVHTIIFILGVVGNLVLVFVAYKTKALQTPTYRFLISLAIADLLVLISAVPEALIFHHVGKRWVAGQIACSLFVFTNFLGINAGSISILAFSVEMYVAICRPLTAQKYCTMPRTNQIIMGIWLFAVLYCCPWLGLTEVRTDLHLPDRKQCDFRLSKEQYFYYFAADLCLFYIAPLLIAAVIYTRIVIVLYKSVRTYERESRSSVRVHHLRESVDGLDEVDQTSCTGPPAAYQCPRKSVTTCLLPSTDPANDELQRAQNIHRRMQSRARVLRMLIVIVILFAICWLPYRGLLVYNTFLKKHWLNLWYMFFAKTLIYFNSAMNPFLYSTMSKRFRRAAWMTLTCRVNKLNSVEDANSVLHDDPSQPVFENETVPMTNYNQRDTNNIQEESTSSPVFIDTLHPDILMRRTPSDTAV
ncbi:thyrotropin-releasing hormone receptor-like isoform X2 [Paramacrobiotus metropolitanus]|uniref:thyrotropin-releasing hormone receptor-like isoform X2 n=1 Tax=Paramacrobiotus metropolitanus TaxID=2943436 RepID=UPI0024457F81|nr:thyrotropin-releasing hormone receptor-like isoform X2 [Paramacrobiotus metropolitanus]